MTRQPTVAAVIHPAKLLLNLFRKRLTRDRADRPAEQALAGMSNFDQMCEQS